MQLILPFLPYYVRRFLALIICHPTIETVFVARLGCFSQVWVDLYVIIGKSRQRFSQIEITAVSMPLTPATI